MLYEVITVEAVGVAREQVARAEPGVSRFEDVAQDLLLRCLARGVAFEAAGQRATGTLTHYSAVKIV